MWGWADPLVEQATKAVYQKVFSVFGIITLCVVGLYLLWRSRQSDMSNAMTTAGWALLVMVAVTALAAWPVKSANIADGTLITTLGVVHDAVGPATRDIPPDQCALPNPDACVDKRPPAVRASDTATETMLYRNWLRGVLGSADSETAQKYGPALYDAKSLTWDEAEKLRAQPGHPGGDDQGQAAAVDDGSPSRSRPRIRRRTNTSRALGTWTGSAPASSRCWPRCSSPCSISPRRCWCCSAS